MTLKPPAPPNLLSPARIRDEQAWPSRLGVTADAGLLGVNVKTAIERASLLKVRAKSVRESELLSAILVDLLPHARPGRGAGAAVNSYRTAEQWIGDASTRTIFCCMSCGRESGWPCETRRILDMADTSCS